VRDAGAVERLRVRVSNDRDRLPASRVEERDVVAATGHGARRGKKG